MLGFKVFVNLGAVERTRDPTLPFPFFPTPSRQVNTQLFSAREKQQLAELIDTMIRYNLTYHQERNFDGQYTYVLDP